MLELFGRGLADDVGGWLQKKSLGSPLPAEMRTGNRLQTDLSRGGVCVKAMSMR